jgi:hypothetical protein
MQCLQSRLYRSAYLRKLAIAFVALGLLMVDKTVYAAHPFHLCVGQMKWNANSQKWEVSVRLHPQDLEKAINAESDQASDPKSISTEDDDFPTTSIAYIEKQLFLRAAPKAMTREELEAILKSESQDLVASDSIESSNPIHRRSKLNWVGMEQEKGWLWIHLEMTPPQHSSQQDRLWMKNGLLLEHVARQENTMSVEPFDSPKFSLQFKQAESLKEFK